MFWYGLANCTVSEHRSFFMKETRGIIKDKTRDLLDLYSFDDYKEAEYLACRIIAGQSIDRIKERLQVKIRTLLMQIPIQKSDEAKKQMELGLKRRINLVKFLDKGILTDVND